MCLVNVNKYDSDSDSDIIELFHMSLANTVVEANEFICWYRPLEPEPYVHSALPWQNRVTDIYILIISR